MIAVDGKQRIVAVGDIIKMSGDQTATVTAITGDSITFDDGKKTETIELAHHTSSVVGHSTAPVVGPTGAMVPTAVGAGKGALDRRGPTRAKPAKDPLAGLDPKARAIVDENNARAALESREVRRKAQRIQLEKETGRTGEEIEKLLDLQEQTGKLDLNSKEVENKGKGGK